MDYLALLESGIDNWNTWRSQHPEDVCDLSNQDLSEGYFVKGNFQNVSFIGSQLRCACFIGANLQGAKLCHADLSGAYMGEADLRGADLTGATLTEANLNRADLRGAVLVDTDISVAHTYRARFSPGAAGVLEAAEVSAAAGVGAVSTEAGSKSSTADKERKSGSATNNTAYTTQKETAQKGTVQKGTAQKEAGQNGLGQKEADRKETGQQRTELYGAALPLRVEGQALRVQTTPAAKESKTAPEVSTPSQKNQSQKSKLTLKKPVAIWLSALLLATALLGLVLSVLGVVPLGNKAGSESGDGTAELADPAMQTAEQLEADELPRLSLVRSVKSDAQVWAIATYTDSSGRPIIISGRDDGVITQWDQRTGESAGSLAGHTDTIRDLAVSESGRWIVSSSGDGIKVWDTQRDELAYSIDAEDSPVWAVAISPSERVFVSADYDGKITVWQLESGKAIYSVEHGASVWGLAIAPDGQTFVSSSSDRTVIQWDLVSGETLQTFGGDDLSGDGQGHQDVVRSVAISPDGSTLVSGSWDSTIKLWSLESGDLLATLAGHDARVVSVAISPDGRTIASGGTDNLLQHWDLSSRELIETVDSSANWILDVTFADVSDAESPITLISSGKDQRINVWQPE